MNFSKGYIVAKPELIEESFSIERGHILINLSAEKYVDVIKDLIECLPTPSFLAYELPCSEEKEEELRDYDDSPFHIDVYYLDGLDYETMKLIIDKMGDILINDGLTQFAFGGLDSETEIMKDRYNLLYIITKEHNPYIEVLKKYNIKQVNQIITAHDIISEDNPGICQKYVDKHGRDSYTLLEALLKMGAYFDHVDES